MKTISDYALLVGELLRRAEMRQKKKSEVESDDATPLRREGLVHPSSMIVAAVDH